MVVACRGRLVSLGSPPSWGHSIHIQDQKLVRCSRLLGRCPLWRMKLQWTEAEHPPPMQANKVALAALITQGGVSQYNLAL